MPTVDYCLSLSVTNAVLSTFVSIVTQKPQIRQTYVYGIKAAINIALAIQSYTSYVTGIY